MNFRELAAWLVFLLAASTSIAAQTYSIKDLGTLENGGTSWGQRVNAFGQVAGWATINGTAHAFRTAPNSPINPATDDLGALGGSSLGWDINDSGQVVGESPIASGYNHGFRTAPNSPINPATDDLGILGEKQSWAFGINGAGQVVGRSTLGWTDHAFRTAPNSPINPATDDLGTLGGFASWAQDINNSGQVVGSSYLPGDTILHAFRTAPNSPINPATDDLGTLGGEDSWALGVNALGQVVGYSGLPDHTGDHPFCTAPNSPINPATDDLGTLVGGSTYAFDVNNSGQVVGWSYTANGPEYWETHAFIYIPGKGIMDLNALIPSGSGWVLWRAEGINDKGQITGTGIINGSWHAYLLTPSTPPPEPGIITTVAGNGTPGYSGDGGSAVSASLYFPTGLAIDGLLGYFFIADAYNYRVRRVQDVTGVITTVAGNGAKGFNGDGIPATSAMLNFPGQVAVDGFDFMGFQFIADSPRVRLVYPWGTIITVAGNGSEGFSGDSGPAKNATLGGQFGIAVDKNGNLFIADTWNERIRYVDAATGIITTVAGNGTQGFSGDGGLAVNAALCQPHGIAIDAKGNFWFDSCNRIRRVDAVTKIITTVAGNGTPGFSGDGGPAIDAALNGPSAEAFDTLGNMFIADTYNQRIRRIDAVTGTITTVAGNGISGFSGDGGPALNASLAAPLGVALDSGATLFIADANNNRVRRVVFPTTPPGQNVIARPVDSVTGEIPITLFLEKVVQAGKTTLSSSSSGQTPPSGFRLGQPPTYFELSTSAVFSGPVGVCINYSVISFHNESSLRLFHWEQGAWVSINASVDTANKVVCGSVTSLSPFALLETSYSATVQQPINTDGSSIFNASRGVVPVKFTLAFNDAPSCNLPTATIKVTRIASGKLGLVDESIYSGTADKGSNFRIDQTACQYVYNFPVSSLGNGTYRVDISIGGTVVGYAVFALR